MTAKELFNKVQEDTETMSEVYEEFSDTAPVVGDEDELIEALCTEIEDNSDEVDGDSDV